MRRHGIENPHADRGRRPALLDDPDWLRGRYVDDVRSMKAIGTEVGADGSTVGRALRQHGIDRPAGIAKRIELDRAWLEQAYSVDRLPVAEIAQLAGVGVGTINRRRADYGIAPLSDASRPVIMQCSGRAVVGRSQSGGRRSRPEQVHRIGVATERRQRRAASERASRHRSQRIPAPRGSTMVMRRAPGGAHGQGPVAAPWTLCRRSRSHVAGSRAGPSLHPTWRCS